jgi:hypothetical protein
MQRLAEPRLQIRDPPADENRWAEFLDCAQPFRITFHRDRSCFVIDTVGNPKLLNDDERELTNTLNELVSWNAN